MKSVAMPVATTVTANAAPASLFGPQADRFSFTVVSRGPVAADVLREDGCGRVHAVFHRSFYIETKVGLACVGTEGFDLGPLGLTTDAPLGTDWRANGVRQGSKIRIRRSIIYIGGRFVLAQHNAAPWRPQPISPRWTRESLARGLAELSAAAIGLAPGEGLAPVLEPAPGAAPESPLCRRARPAILALCHWLHHVFLPTGDRTTGPPDAIVALVGLGPGLTPSGDDFIAGVLLALHSLNEDDTRRRLWQTLRPEVVATDNAISLAHLDAAANGLGNAGAHRAMAALLGGDAVALRSALTAVDSIGHTSGWDALAGIVTTYSTWLSAGSEKLGRG